MHSGQAIYQLGYSPSPLKVKDLHMFPESKESGLWRSDKSADKWVLKSICNLAEQVLTAIVSLIIILFLNVLILSHTLFNLHLQWTIGCSQEAYETLMLKYSKLMKMVKNYNNYAKSPTEDFLPHRLAMTIWSEITYGTSI